VLGLGGVSFIFQNNPPHTPCQASGLSRAEPRKLTNGKRSCHKGGRRRVSAHSNSALSLVSGVRPTEEAATCCTLRSDHTAAHRQSLRNNITLHPPPPKKPQGNFVPACDFLASATK